MTVRRFGGLNRFFIRKTEKKPDIESTRGQVSSLVKEAGLPDTERKMLDNVLSFSSTEVSEAMVPRVNIVAVPFNSSLKDCIEVLKKASTFSPTCI
jgi:Hemolysins and related proteins containing CBS domains